MRKIKRLAQYPSPEIENPSTSLLYSLLDGLAPDSNLTFLDFCNQKVIIPKSTGAKHYGQYSTAFTPHVEEILKALDITSEYRRVIVQGCAQSFKTQTALNLVLYLVDQHPSNILYLSPSGTLQKRLINRLDKTIASNPTVQNKFSKPNSRTDPNNASLKSFTGGTLFLGSANSPNSLSEVPAPYVLGDETDRWDDNVAGEGDPTALAEKRSTSYGSDAKSYFFSTPTITGRSKIESLFLKGTKREPLAECIACGHAQELIFEELKMDEYGQAFYPCKECGFVHYEHDKQKMFEKGLWSEAKEFDGETASFHYHALFLPYGGVSWSTVLHEFNQAKAAFEEKADDNLMRAFLNTRLARTFSPETSTTTAQKLIETAEDYKLNTVPSKGTFVLCTVDVQETRFECSTWAFSHNLECWHIDHTAIYGSPDDKDIQKQLYEYLTREVQHESGKKLRIQTSFIDSGGHYTKEIYAFCHGHKAQKIIPIKGSSNPLADPIKTASKIKIEGSLQPLLLYVLGVNQTKDYIAKKLGKKNVTGQFHFSKHLSSSFFEGLLAEYREVAIHRGKQVTRWVKKIGQNNEPLDLLVYAICAAYYNAIHRMSQKKIDEYREKLGLNIHEIDIEPVPEIKTILNEDVEVAEEIPMHVIPKKKSRFRPRTSNMFNNRL